MGIGALGAVIRALRSLKEHIVAGYTQVNMAEAQVCQMLDQMSDLCSFGEWFIWTARRQRTRVACQVEVELLPFCSVITAALTESEGTLIYAIGDVSKAFPAEAFLTLPGPSAESSSGVP